MAVEHTPTRGSLDFNQSESLASYVVTRPSGRGRQKFAKHLMLERSGYEYRGKELVPTDRAYAVLDWRGKLLGGRQVGRFSSREEAEDAIQKMTPAGGRATRYGTFSEAQTAANQSKDLVFRDLPTLTFGPRGERAATKVVKFGGRRIRL